MPLPAYIETHRTDVVTATAWLVEFRFAVYQRLTTWKDPISYGGNTFSPYPLKVDGVTFDSSGLAASAGGLTLGTGDDYWPALLASLATEATRHPVVALYEVWLDPVTLYPTPLATRAIATFLLESAEWTPSSARITLAPIANPALGRLPFREYGGGLCTYRIRGGTQCGNPAAAGVCDGTYETCGATFSNQARFGGFREMPPETVTITWRWTDGTGLREETLTLGRREE